ncbi:MAG TPA: hypothetical protein VN664_17835 [Burkholderiales bacterium]|nr:hypothetical protein [Burkholderiales bacterium]
MTVKLVHPRRRFLIGLGAVPLLAIAGARAQVPAMISRPGSGYRFLPGGQVFAGGAVAEPGYELVHALLARWLPLEQGYALVETHLKAMGRPVHALCGMQLRLPRQLSPEEFAEFNAPYIAHLKAWDLLYDGQNPISRTNVSPAVSAPKEPSLHAFSYAVLSDRNTPTFTMSGMTERAAGTSVIAPGDVSPSGMRTKLAHVLSVVGSRIAELGFDWHHATHVELYAAEEIPEAMAALAAKATGAMPRGVRWHHGRPPVIGLELELEARAVAREVMVG